MYHIIVIKWTAWQWMDPPTRLGIVSLCKLAQTKWKQSKLNIRWNARVRWNRETRHYIDLKSGRRGVGTNIKSLIRTKRVQFCDLCFKTIQHWEIWHQPIVKRTIWHHDKKYGQDKNGPSSHCVTEVRKCCQPSLFSCQRFLRHHFQHRQQHHTFMSQSHIQSTSDWLDKAWEV